MKLAKSICIGLVLSIVVSVIGIVATFPVAGFFAAMLVKTDIGLFLGFIGLLSFPYTLVYMPVHLMIVVYRSYSTSVTLLQRLKVLRKTLLVLFVVTFVLWSVLWISGVYIA